MKDWSKVESVRRETRRAIEFLTGEITSFVQDRLEDEGVSELMESPLEAAFFVWWTAYSYYDRCLVSGREIELIPNKPITVDGVNYRLDFMVWPVDDLDLAYQVSITPAAPQLPKICIELDGHEFHERTKEQVAIRDGRDRALLADGWKVLHYSGSAFYRRPQECVMGAHDFATREIYQWRRLCERFFEGAAR